MPYMRTLAVPLVLLVANTSTAQTLAELTERLSKAESVDDEAVGDGGDKSDTWRTYEKWRAAATVAQLREFTRHDSPIVRAYGVRALVETEADVDFAAIAAEHVTDTAEVMTFQGCCKAKQAVGDVILEVLRPKLGEGAMLDLAEILIAKKSTLCAREWSLRVLRLRDGMLHTVRDLATAGDRPALIALARYRLAPDVPLLAKCLRVEDPFADNCAFAAAEIHADPALLGPLLALEGKARRRLEAEYPVRLESWLRAVAAQRSADAGALLKRFLEETPVGEKWREQELCTVWKRALAPQADCAALGDARTALQRRIEQTPR